MMATLPPTGLEGQPIAETMNGRFRQRIEASKRGMQKLGVMMDDAVKAEQVYAQKTKIMVDSLNVVASYEHSRSLKKAFEACAVCIEKIQGVRKTYLSDRVRRNIFTLITKYPKELFKPGESLVADFERTQKALHTAQKQYQDVRTTSNDKPKKDASETAYIDAKARAFNTEATFLEMSRRMELKRIDDMKKALDEYIRAQMYVHCKALEYLTELSKSVDAIKPVDEARYFFDLLDCATVGRSTAPSRAQSPTTIRETMSMPPPPAHIISQQPINVGTQHTQSQRYGGVAEGGRTPLQQQQQPQQQQQQYQPPSPRVDGPRQVPPPTTTQASTRRMRPPEESLPPRPSSVASGGSRDVRDVRDAAHNQQSQRTIMMISRDTGNSGAGDGGSVSGGIGGGGGGGAVGVGMQPQASSRSMRDRDRSDREPRDESRVTPRDARDRNITPREGREGREGREITPREGREGREITPREGREAREKERDDRDRDVGTGGRGYGGSDEPQSRDRRDDRGYRGGDDRSDRSSDDFGRAGTQSQYTPERRVPPLPLQSSTSRRALQQPDSPTASYDQRSPDRRSDAVMEPFERHPQDTSLNHTALQSIDDDFSD